MLGPVWSVVLILIPTSEVYSCSTCLFQLFQAASLDCSLPQSTMKPCNASRECPPFLCVLGCSEGQGERPNPANLKSAQGNAGPRPAQTTASAENTGPIWLHEHTPESEGCSLPAGCKTIPPGRPRHIKGSEGQMSQDTEQSVQEQVSTLAGCLGSAWDNSTAPSHTHIPSVPIMMWTQLVSSFHQTVGLTSEAGHGHPAQQ